MIHPHIRETAALICAIAASSNVGSDNVARHIGVRSKKVDALVSQAFAAAGDAPWTRDRMGGFDAQNWPVQMAEAEAMLRTGWSPAPPDLAALDRAVDEFKRSGARTVREVEESLRPSFRLRGKIG